ncbi:MAG: twin-arginine translocase TatA/TatE family subunit [Arcobacteraceae bacterium]
MSMPGGMEWVLIALVVLLLFGGKKIPELAKGLGSGIRNFKKAVKEDDDDVALKSEEKSEDKKVEDKKVETKPAETTADTKHV